MVKGKFVVALLLVGILLLTGCSDLSKLVIEFDARSVLELGEVVELTAIGKTGINTDADLEAVVEWHVNDESVGVLSTDNETALLTVVGEGEIVVTASSGELEDSVTFTAISTIPDPLVFQESFEEHADDQYPEGWLVVNQEVHDTTDYSGGRITSESASDGSKSIRLVSIPEAEGRVEYEFDEPLLYHKLTVDLKQQATHKENVNIELHGENGRLFGLFVTGSGNVRYRHPDGSNGDNVTNIPNDSWHTIEFEWNDADKRYKAWTISAAGERVEITPGGGTSYELEFIDDQVTKLSIAITQRDGDKIAFIDNIEVIDLAALEMLQ